MIGGWRKLFNLELNNLYSPDIVRTIKSRKASWLRLVACMGGMRTACRVLVKNPEGQRTLQRSKHRWENNIKLELIETRSDGVDQCQLLFP